MADDLTNESQNEAVTSGASETPAPEKAPESTAAPESTGAAAPTGAGAPTGGGGQDSRGRGRRNDRQGGPGRGGFGARGRRDAGREPGELDETVVKIYRCATVVKGGRRFSFAALVVVGDRVSKVGVGYGKANEVPSAVEKARKAAQRNLVQVKLEGTTIPHQVLSKYRASKVMMLPAGKGTGVIAGASVRAVMELAGVKDVLTKVYGSTGPKNLVKAAFQGLVSLRTKDDVVKLRGVSVA